MTMRLCIINLLLLFSLLSANAVMPTDTLSVEDSLKYFYYDSLAERGVYLRKSKSTEYDRRVDKYRKHWAALIPTQLVVQNAGNMGFMSVGIGWDYGKHSQWETNLLFGYLPEYKSNRGKLTMTLKQNYIPWSIYLKDGWSVEPLSCGLYLNTVFGSEFWDRQPARYPDKYYEFLSTKMRANVFVGQRLTKIVPHNKRKMIKSITAFYEVSTCDLYVRSMIIDNYPSLWDILGLSIGIKLQML